MQTSTSSLTTINSDSVIQFLPFNFIRSGQYYYSSGNPDLRSSRGYYWELSAYSEALARTLLFFSTYLFPQNSNYKGNGYPLRCLVSLVPHQLPTYNGTKSYQNLLVEVYGMEDTGYHRLLDVDIDTNSHNSAVNLIRSGYYGYYSGGTNSRGYDGFYWESTPSNTTNALYLRFNSNLLNSQYSDNKGYGLALRCLVR